MSPERLLLGVLASYLVGGIPFGFLVARTVRGVDIRKHGSGNIGATNVGRICGRAWGVVVLLLDAAKGFCPAFFLPGLLGEPLGHEKALFAAAAIAGHVWPVYLRFRGGKGVATGAGASLAVAPLPTAAAAAVWVVVALTTRYVSVASITAAASLPVAVVVAGWYRGGISRSAFAFTVVMAAIVIVRHRSNIARLRQGTESKIRGRVECGTDPDTG